MYQRSKLNGKLARQPLSVIDAQASKLLIFFLCQEDPILRYMTKFKRGRDNGYTLITPASPLLQLEEFLEDHLFALGTLRARFDHIALGN